MKCPNCITPWKCNGPHLEYVSDTIYNSEYGYFTLKDNIWTWLPKEQNYFSDQLMLILETIEHLNETITQTT